MKVEFFEMMQFIFDVEMEMILAIDWWIKVRVYQVFFIIGVGQVFFFIWLYNVLNNLQCIVKIVFIIMFFLGAYVIFRSGFYLCLFDILKDDNYYWVFNFDNINL